MAAWLAVCVTIAALVYAWRQFHQAKEQGEDLAQPNVAMFMEPSASDWHLVELVVKNFGQKPAYGIKFEFATPPTVPRYESADADNYVDIVPLKLPLEIPYLAPSQEWRTVWDSALDRKQLGESIGSRFAGAVTFYDQPNSQQGKTKGKRSARQFRTPAVLDWAQLHPVERLELLTTHDLARQEKQKLELLRGLLDLLPLRVDRKPPRGASGRDQPDQRGRQRAARPLPQPVRRPAGGAGAVARRRLRWRSTSFRRSSGTTAIAERYDGLPPSYDEPPPPYDEEPPYDDDDAQTRVISNSGPRVINGRHRRGMA